MPTSSGSRMGLSSATALLYFSSIFNLAASHALPRQTKTIDFRDLNVLPWPLATAAPAPPDSLLRRQLNTVCGYVGGNPDLPATCSAGSHCAVDVEHGAIGCCPDGVPCTQGVFTGCVDGNSGPQTELNPYVYTCQGGNVCYKNNFEGGFFQYGCGSASDIGTSVHGTASGKERIEITSLSAQLTATPTALSEPTTLGTMEASSEASSSIETSSGVTSSETATSETSSATNSETTSSATESTSTESTSTESASRTTSSTSSSSSTASSTAGASAPDTEDDDNGKKHTGAIIGGTISGVAALVAAVALGIWLWRRKKGNTRQGPGLQANSQYVSPVSQGQHNFAPVPSGQEMDEVSPYPPAPPPASLARGNYSEVTSDGRGHSPEPYSTTTPYNYGYPPGSALGGSTPLEHDEVPLTREETTREPDDYGYGYGHGLTRIEEEDDPRPVTGGGPIHSPRGGGGGPFFQQNRGPGWF